MSSENKPGYFKDRDGNWRKDRRSGKDRRAVADGADLKRERRRLGRREEDRRIERDHREMIEEALEDFAAEHED